MNIIVAQLWFFKVKHCSSTIKCTFSFTAKFRNISRLFSLFLRSSQSSQSDLQIQCKYKCNERPTLRVCAYVFEWKIGPSFLLSKLAQSKCVSDVSDDCKTAHSILAGLTGAGPTEFIKREIQRWKLTKYKAQVKRTNLRYLTLLKYILR